MNDRILALEAALRGEQQGEHAEWAASLVAAGKSQRGWDPTPWTADWRRVLAYAGVPFAAGGDRPMVAVDTSALTVSSSLDGQLRLPPLKCFAGLTSLPLKPLRLFVQRHYHLRLQLGIGIHMCLWSNQVVVINASADQRDGFLYGPQHGMRLPVSLPPGAAQELTW